MYENAKNKLANEILTNEYKPTNEILTNEIHSRVEVCLSPLRESTQNDGILIDILA